MTMFKQKNSLQVPSCISSRKWELLHSNCEHRANVRGHVVASFVVMLEVGCTFGNKTIEKFSDRGAFPRAVSMMISCNGVTDEYSRGACLNSSLLDDLS